MHSDFSYDAPRAHRRGRGDKTNNCVGELGMDTR